MEENNKKTILLENLFFNNDKELVSEIIKEVLEYDEIIYQGNWYDAVIIPSILAEYIARYDTYVDADSIMIGHPNYGKTIVYHQVARKVENDAEFQFFHPQFENSTEYQNRYDGMELRLNMIDHLVEY